MLVVSIFANGDHVCVAWRPEKATPSDWRPIAGCRGFAIQRRVEQDGHQPALSWLRNRIGFHQGEAAPHADEAWRWPIQRYMWWDYDVAPGQTVSYRVVPVLANQDGLVAPDPDSAEWTEPTKIGPDAGKSVKAWFNRGVVATQWVTRALKARGAGAPRTTLLEAVSNPGDPLRNALSGHLRPALLDLLTEAPGDVYAALYELNDPEVIQAFVGLGGRCHMILGNGAFKSPDMDENDAIREQLRHTDIDLHDRIVGNGHFAHNKFVVFCDAAGVPASVWTGSTNLTVTGLCTQVNNGILITNADVAADFKAAWCRLRKAGNDYTDDLVDGNSTAESRQVDDMTITSWFAATRHAEDMEAARALIQAATDGILFLFFKPGAHVNEPFKETLLQTILEKKAKGDLYVRGVVNQEITGLTDAVTPPVNLVRSGSAHTSHLTKAVLVPAAITADYGQWETELKGASSVMVHSKVIVLDPFGAKPVVMTGSHNEGYKASSKNDDNLVIIEGNPALAQAYAANIVAIFQEYRWRDYVATHHDGGWKGLEDDDKWQSGHLEREASDMLFWVPAALG